MNYYLYLCNQVLNFIITSILCTEVSQLACRRYSVVGYLHVIKRQNYRIIEQKKTLKIIFLQLTLPHHTSALGSPVSWTHTIHHKHLRQRTNIYFTTFTQYGGRPRDPRPKLRMQFNLPTGSLVATKPSYDFDVFFYKKALGADSF